MQHLVRIAGCTHLADVALRRILLRRERHALVFLRCLGATVQAAAGDQSHRQAELGIELPCASCTSTRLSAQDPERLPAHTPIRSTRNDTDRSLVAPGLLKLLVHLAIPQLPPRSSSCTSIPASFDSLRWSSNR